MESDMRIGPLKQVTSLLRSKAVAALAHLRPVANELRRRAEDVIERSGLRPHLEKLFLRSKALVARLAPQLRVGKLSSRSKAAIGFVVLCFAFGAILIGSKADRGRADADLKSPAKSERGVFRLTPKQWATLTIEPVAIQSFRTEQRTEGKITVDEDRSTPIFSPYAGRVTKLLVSPGDTVQRGQPLFVLEAADSVQGQNDFITAVTAVNKARSQVTLTETTERRLHNLYDANAMPLKDWQQAQADLTAAKNDLRTAETTLEAMRNRLRILGKTDAEIDTFQQSGAITPDSTVYAPLAGTIVQRKVGPGQYITAGSSDPVFVIGDLSTVWLVAFVRESDASKVKLDQTIRFTVLTYPDQVFEAKINYIATSIDPASRRLMVRATIDNSQALLKLEMFASVIIVTDEGVPMTAVPREAVIYEGDIARAWVAVEEMAVELRTVKLGLSNGRLIQVLDGLAPGEKVVTRGSLFIDRMASGGQ
ncbi:MAG TPA: efflux RND transporter periplasmic adaptor subunit [Xanthobacteraceae bacterium]|nr:efflux RND transporter periplasmic adaptor subunit [Xanthobacteraceae bacterium]